MWNKTGNEFKKEKDKILINLIYNDKTRGESNLKYYDGYLIFCSNQYLKFWTIQTLIFKIH